LKNISDCARFVNFSEEDKSKILKVETTKYKYSTKQTTYVILLFVGIIIFGCYEIKTDAPADDLWKIMIPFVILFGAFLVYVCYKYLLPILRGEAALEMDSYQLQYRITNLTISWKDVASISYSTGSRSSSWSISFFMNDGGKPKTMPTLYIAGDNSAIYNTIIAYFEKYK
jgi:hypothetical protein